jgi:hypothetical protein
MELLFGGRSTLTHINSVLRVGRVTNCPLFVLTMSNAADVCAPLVTEYNQFAISTRVYEPATHTTNDPLFLNFIAAHQNLVVMGFDAGVCVFANVFGCDERNPDNSFRTPLLSSANIVMSRAALVSNGNVWSMSPTLGQAEYGPIFNQ